MEITEAVKIENEAIVALNFKYKFMYAPTDRFRLLAGFCAPFSRVLSIGCASYEPIQIKATHACDIVQISEQFLRKQGWAGDFLVCSFSTHISTFYLFGDLVQAER